MADERLLKVRKELKARKPEFTKQDRHKKPRLDAGWRKPKGRHSKMREHKKGHPVGVSKGWKAPTTVRHLTQEGLQQVIVHAERDFLNLNSKQHAIVVSGTVGLRKKILLIQKAVERKLTIVNLKNPQKFLEDTLTLLKQKKEARTKKAAEKEQKKEVLEKEAKKKAEEKKGIEGAVSEEEKKKQEKEEKDKVLTQVQ